MLKKAKRRNLTEDQKKNIFAGFVDLAFLDALASLRPIMEID